MSFVCVLTKIGCSVVNLSVHVYAPREDILSSTPEIVNLSELMLLSV